MFPLCIKQGIHLHVQALKKRASQIRLMSSNFGSGALNLII